MVSVVVDRDGLEEFETWDAACAYAVSAAIRYQVVVVWWDDDEQVWWAVELNSRVMYHQ